MFSLIITVISIALVTALALATIYYGGSAFKQGAGKARAAELITQGQQLLGAAELFNINRGVYPNTMQELVTYGYLNALPTALNDDTFGAISVAQAAVGAWTIPTPGQPTFVVLQRPTESTCRNVNALAYGSDGIFTKAYASYSSQCYGATANLTIVVTKSAAALVASLSVGDVVNAAPPTGTPGTSATSVNNGTLPDTTNAAWSMTPLRGSGAPGIAPVVVVAPRVLPKYVYFTQYDFSTTLSSSAAGACALHGSQIGHAGTIGSFVDYTGQSGECDYYYAGMNGLQRGDDWNRGFCPSAPDGYTDSVCHPPL